MSDKLDALLPDAKNNKVVVAGREMVLEPMCAYKVAQVLKALSKFSDDIKISEIVEAVALSQGQVNIVQAATTFIPRLAVIAPDALVAMLALVVIPNEELAVLSESPDGIQKKIAENAKFFNFTATTDDVVTLATAAIPLIGLDSLKKSLPALGQRVMETLGVQLQQPSMN